MFKNIPDYKPILSTTYKKALFNNFNGYNHSQNTFKHLKHDILSFIINGLYTTFLTPIEINIPIQLLQMYQKNRT